MKFSAWELSEDWEKNSQELTGDGYFKVEEGDPWELDLLEPSTQTT